MNSLNRSVYSRPVATWSATSVQPRHSHSYTCEGVNVKYGRAVIPGCGRKRSDESMATLVDLNSEPAVEDLSRQILSEAKLWEAIQEARVELLRKHNEQVNLSVNFLGVYGLLLRVDSLLICRILILQ